MKKQILIPIILLLLAVVAFSAYQLIGGLMAYKAIDDYYQAADEKYVLPAATTEAPAETTPVPGAAQTEAATPSVEPEADISEEQGPVAEETVIPLEYPPISVDFDTLLADAPDTVGWLYGVGGKVNLPVVQGEDNEYYLRRLPDGTYSFGGSLFLDYMAGEGFSDQVSFVYGHNMRNGSMLQPITAYRSQEVYEANPLMYLLTPEGNYKVELFSGFITDIESDAYTSYFGSEEEFLAYLYGLRERSEFVSTVELTAEDRILGLSTCTYEYEDARYVLFGKLTPIG